MRSARFAWIGSLLACSGPKSDKPFYDEVEDTDPTHTDDPEDTDAHDTDDTDTDRIHTDDTDHTDPPVDTSLPLRNRPHRHLRREAASLRRSCP